MGETEAIAPDVAAAFERARLLIAEARRGGSKATALEQQILRDAALGLERAMERTPFDAGHFRNEFIALKNRIERKKQWRPLAVALAGSATFFLAIFGFRAFALEAFKIPSGSMHPTLLIGDHLFVSKLAYGLFAKSSPKRGDVIVFAYPEDPRMDFVKRVISLPGDRIEVHGGHPRINGWEVPSCLVGTFVSDEIEPSEFRTVQLFVEYLGTESYLTIYDTKEDIPGQTQGPYSVTANQAFVLGDNRHHAYDSRLWFNGQGGGVPFETIRGRASFFFASADNARVGKPVMGPPRLPASLSKLHEALEKCLRERPAVTDPPPPK